VRIEFFESKATGPLRAVPYCLSRNKPTPGPQLSTTASHDGTLSTNTVKATG